MQGGVCDGQLVQQGEADLAGQIPGKKPRGRGGKGEEGSDESMPGLIDSDNAMRGMMRMRMTLSVKMMRGALIVVSEEEDQLSDGTNANVLQNVVDRALENILNQGRDVVGN